MNIHEYQAKAVLREFGVPVPRGHAGFLGRRGGQGARGTRQPGLGGQGADPCRRPRQGRRRQGGASRSTTCARRPTRLLGSTLVTHQTGPHGKQVNRLYIEEGSAIDREFYLSALVDRETSRVAFVVSTEGGMDIEEVAHDTPEKIVTFSVDPATGIMPHHGRARRAGARARRRSGQAGERAARRSSTRPSSPRT